MITLEIGNLDTARKALVVLHGRGGSAEGIAPLAKVFANDFTYIVAPEAENHTWYPYSFMSPRMDNEPWLSASVARVTEHVLQCVNAVGASNTLLIGFSQGACLALEVSARLSVGIGAVAAFTGGLIGEQIEPTLYGAPLTGTQVYIGTSDIDAHVPLQRSEDSAEVLRKLGASVQLEVFPGMGHTIAQAEIQSVTTMLQRAGW